MPAPLHVSLRELHDALPGAAENASSKCTGQRHGLRSVSPSLGVQGILDVFLREPLLDWEREARVLQASRRPKHGGPTLGSEGAGEYVAEKVCFRFLVGRAPPAESCVSRTLHTCSSTGKFGGLMVTCKKDSV